MKDVDGIDAVAFEKSIAGEISNHFGVVVRYMTYSVGNRKSSAGIGWDPSCVQTFRPLPLDSSNQPVLLQQMVLFHLYHILPFRANESKWSGTKP